MRILRVAQNFDGHVFPLSEAQAKMGHDVTVLRPCESDERPGVFEQDGYTLVRKPCTFEIVGNKFATGVGKDLLRVNEYDVVHAHSHLFFSTNLASLSRVFGGTPLAITNHGVHSQSVPEWFSKAYLSTLGRWTYNRADAVFCYTEVDQRRLRKYGVTTNCNVVPNGIDSGRFVPDGATSKRIDHNGPTVLLPGAWPKGNDRGVQLGPSLPSGIRGSMLTFISVGMGPCVAPSSIS
ncbi:glycosyltransferase family 4 protein [Haloarculaceae archaeon H-GB2-1]|nr:glycosyltransferase family 4 protein [Haloarculaceae archaeon H-GB2-1]